MDAKVHWQGGMTFIGSADSGFPVRLDSDESVGGDNSGARPMELLAIGLAGCTAMDILSIMNKKRQQVTDFSVQVLAGRAEEHPKVFTNARVEYSLTGRNIEEAAVLRAIELSTTRYCPANAMFSRLMPMEFRYHIYEAVEEGQRVLIKSGEYRPAVSSKADPIVG